MWTSVLIAVAAWLLLVLAGHRIVMRRAARSPTGEPVGWLLWLAVRVYCRLMHRPRYTGREHVPPSRRPGGLVVVSNHTSPVDPLLIQAVCRFEIRWMMASDMMIPRLKRLWRRLRIIPVARNGRDTGPAREAIRHVRDGGVVGIFPEGGLVRPGGELRPFHQGVGLVVARTRAPVLLVWITGTPEPVELGRALAAPSHAQVHFLDRIEFGDADPAAITETLRRRIAEASGWRLNDEPLVPRSLNADPFVV